MSVIARSAAKQIARGVSAAAPATGPDATSSTTGAREAKPHLSVIPAEGKEDETAVADEPNSATDDEPVSVPAGAKKQPRPSRGRASAGTRPPSAGSGTRAPESANPPLLTSSEYRRMASRRAPYRSQPGKTLRLTLDESLMQRLTRYEDLLQGDYQTLVRNTFIANAIDLFPDGADITPWLPDMEQLREAPAGVIMTHVPRETHGKVGILKRKWRPQLPAISASVIAAAALNWHLHRVEEAEAAALLSGSD